MIACPLCSAKTTVIETRGARRRRVCTATGCTGKVTTVEISVSLAPGSAIGDNVLVPARQLSRLRKVLDEIGGAA